MSAVTARSIIKDALTEIRVLGIGQTVNSEVEQRAFRKLNNLLESLSLDDFMIVAWEESSSPLVVGTARYTVGSGGDFNKNRPLEVMDDCYIRSGATDYRVRLVTHDVYRFVSSKATQALPRFFSYLPEFPLGKFSFYPTPNSTDEFIWRARVVLAQFATLTTEVNFYPGFERYLIYALAVEISAQNGKKVTAELIGTLADARDKVVRQNATPIVPVRLDDINRMTGRSWTTTIMEGPYT